jgi:hypothetical protein
MEAVPHKQKAGREVLDRNDQERQTGNSGFTNGNVPMLPQPPKMPDNYYVPDEHTAAWDNPGEIFQGIVDTIQSIDSMAMLGKYWSSLEAVKVRWEKENPEWIAELKDNFTNRTAEIGRN